MKPYILLLLLASLLMVLNSCEDYVTGIDPMIDAVQDDRLNDESQIPFLITGVKYQYSIVQDRLYVIADGLSDAFMFDTEVPNATYETFGQVDRGEILLDNASSGNPFNNNGELRFFADDLIRRVNSISFEDEALKEEALFTGNLYGGIARYFYACYFGLNPTEGGATIDNSSFIPSNDMYDLAIEGFTEALNHTNDAWELKVVHSLIARAYLYKGDNANANTHIEQGLVNGDDPFQSLHNVDSDNYWWQQAGALRPQFIPDWRFVDLVAAEPQEANRIILEMVVDTDGNPIIDTETGRTFYFQNIYGETSPLNHISWQECNLIKAELAIQGSGAGDALVLVNEERASHSIDPLTEMNTIDQLLAERDKELFTTAARVIDQRRYNKWHLAAGTWQYFPLSEDERNNNPNID